MPTLVERDEAGVVTSTYITAVPERIDIIRPPNTKSPAQRLLGVFLPAGYPFSVTEDYMQYQIYDSLQAFSSAIAGMLASRAVLEGVGVGDPTAHPTTALLLSALQDSLARLTTILFAHRLGTALEPECKTYRLLADIFNDTAMVLDCLSPALPKPIRVLVLGFSSALRALCGVCAGSAKASLSRHFARRGNLGEVNAKDSSQETVISLLGMLAGSIVVSWVTTPLATWTVLIGLLSVHLATNYAAVKAVSMRCLNRQRANIVFASILQHGQVPSPTHVSKQERVFERDGVLRWIDNRIVGYGRIGVPLEALLSRMAPQHKRPGSLHARATALSGLLDVFADEAYLLWFAECDDEVLIVLKHGCSPTDQLKAWAHALLLAHGRSRPVPESETEDDEAVLKRQLAEMTKTLVKLNEVFGKYTGRLKQKGWDLEVAVLETRPGTRVETSGKKSN